MRFTTLFVLSSAVVSGLSQSIPIIQDSIGEITSQVNNLVKVGTPFGTTVAATFDNALTLHDLLEILAATISRAARQVQATPQPFSNEDSTTIVSTGRDFEPAILSAIALVRTKKSPLGGLIPFPLNAIVNPLKIGTNDLIAIQTGSAAFGQAVVSAVDDANKPDAMDLANTVNSAIAAAVLFFQS